MPCHNNIQHSITRIMTPCSHSLSFHFRKWLGHYVHPCQLWQDSVHVHVAISSHSLETVVTVRGVCLGMPHARTCVHSIHVTCSRPGPALTHAIVGTSHQCVLLVQLYMVGLYAALTSHLKYCLARCLGWHGMLDRLEVLFDVQLVGAGGTLGSQDCAWRHLHAKGKRLP